jgi:hypothetical protein
LRSAFSQARGCLFEFVASARERERDTASELLTPLSSNNLSFHCETFKRYFSGYI